MPELRCTVQTCLHNKQNYCDLSTIEVKGSSATSIDGTCCGSFVERKGNTTSDVTGSASPTSAVDCKATHCMYNKECKCHAGKISVEGSNACKSDDTVCATFEKH